MHKPSVLRSNVENSLCQLQTDSVDIFYLHAANRSTPFVETLEEINHLYNEEKIKQFGLSNFTAFEVAEIVVTCYERGWVRPTIYQAMYNALSKSLFGESRKL
jgi:aflatoxin B1 aldehyde reductase